MPNVAPVEPHTGVERLFDDVFCVTGSVQFKPLVRLNRNMVVIKTGDELTVINSVRVDGDAKAELDALGKVAHVVKIGFHGMDDAWYVEEYGAKLWTLPGIDHGDLVADELLKPEHVPIRDAQLFTFEHTNKPEAALLINRHGGLLVTCDSVQHWEAKPFMSLMGKLITKAMGFQYPAQIGPPWSKVQTPEGGSLKPDFERMVALPFKHIIGGHGGLLRDKGPQLLQASIDRKWPSSL